MAKPSSYSASLSQWRPSTRSRRMALASATGPPKPSAPRRRKYRGSSQSDGRGGSPAVAGLTSSMEISPCRDRRSIGLDGQVVELDHRVGLGPQPDAPGLAERVVGRVEHLGAIEPDHEVVAARVDLERVPGLRRDFDRMVLEGSPGALDDVIDGAVVLVGIAASEIVV